MTPDDLKDVISSLDLLVISNMCTFFITAIISLLAGFKLGYTGKFK